MYGPGTYVCNKNNMALCGDTQVENSGFHVRAARRYPQGGGNPLHNGNVAVTAADVRHYPFRAFRGNGALVSGIESAVRWINGNINRETYIRRSCGLASRSRL